MATGSFGGSDLGMGISFTLKDRFSKTANRIQGKMRGLSSSASRNFKKFNGTIKQHAKAIAAYGSIALIGLGVAAAAAYKQFVKFDDHMADVRKTVGLTEKETETFGNTILEMSKKTRTSADDLVTIAAIGGQMGIGKKGIEGFTKSVNVLGVAIGDEFGGVDEMTNSVGKLRNVMSDFKTDDVGSDVLHIGNALNSLSSSGQATAGTVSNMAKRILSRTAGLKIASSDILGLAAVLEEGGLRAEIAGSGTARLLSTMSNNYTKFANVAGMSSKKFADILNNDANEALTVFMKGLKGSNLEGIEYNALLKDLGINGDGLKAVLGVLTKNMGKLTDKQKQVKAALKGTNSVMGEYNIKNENAAAQIAKLKNKVSALVIQVGKKLRPAFGAIAAAVSKVITVFVDWWKSLSPFTKGVLKYIAIGLGALAVALTVYAAAQAIATTAIWANTVALLANPITWIILGIVILVATLIQLQKQFQIFTKTWEFIKFVFTKIWDFIKFVSIGIWKVVKAYLMFIFNIYKTIFMAIWNVISTVFTWISDKVAWLMDIFVSLGTSMYDLGSNIVSSVWGGIKSGWRALVDWVKNAAAGLVGFITSPFESIGNSISGLFGGGDGSGQGVNNSGGGGGATNTPAPVSVASGNHFIPMSGQKTVTNNNNTTQEKMQPIIIRNEMDGEAISEQIIEKQKRNKSRKE